MGKRYRVWSVGVTVAWLVATSACGSRNQLPGGLAVEDEDDGDVVNGVGGNNSGPGGNSGPGVTSVGPGGNGTPAVTAVSNGVTSTTGGIAVSSQASGSFGVGGSTTGVGGGSTCYWPDNPGGQGGEAGASSEPASCPLNFCGGWAPREGNCADIQGLFYTYADGMSGGTSTAYVSSSADNLICVSGQVGQVFNGQFDVYWGAGFGLSLNQPAPDAERQPYDAEYNGVTGFGFWIAGYFEPGELRFEVRGEDDYYCETIYPGGGYNEFTLANLTKGCWDPVGTPHDYSRLLSLEWHFVSNAQFSYYYDVCMAGLTVYRSP